MILCKNAKKNRQLMFSYMNAWKNLVLYSYIHRYISQFFWAGSSIQFQSHLYWLLKYDETVWHALTNNTYIFDVELYTCWFIHELEHSTVTDDHDHFLKLFFLSWSMKTCRIWLNETTRIRYYRKKSQLIMICKRKLLFIMIYNSHRELMMSVSVAYFKSK